jgi:capsular exopolysaccharide synthesis family protein
MRRETALQMVAITSPGSGDGKSVTTLNLAGSLAQSPDARVLVIDADLHRPSIARYLGLDCPEGKGLADVLSIPDGRLDQVVQRIDALNLSVLPAGVGSRVYELLNSSRLESVLTDARRSFDFVVIDTPPLVPLPDCRVIAQWVDGFIMIVTAHRTPRRAVAEALNLLDPSKVIGLVFNGDDRPLARYSSYYGYYGKSDRTADKPDGRSVWQRAKRS